MEIEKFKIKTWPNPLEFVKGWAFLFLAVVPLLISSSRLYAQTPSGPVYYIDFQNGDDTNDGLSQAKPWKHIPGTNVIGTATANGTPAYIQSCFGPPSNCTVKLGTFSKLIYAGTTFKIKSGSVYNNSVGGWILISQDFYWDSYTGGGNDKPIIFEPDPTWGSGPVVFDGSGMFVSESIILIKQVDGVHFDGLTPRGIIVMNSPLTGLRYKTTYYSTPLKDPVVSHVYFLNNGTSDTTDTGGAAVAGLHFKNSIGGSVSFCEFNGNHQYVLGFFGGEGHMSATGLTVSDCKAYNHKGDAGGTNDSGIGFKAQNSQITFKNNISFNNLKGFDLGEDHGDGRDITYKVINSLLYGNFWGVNFSGVGIYSSSDPVSTGKVNFYLINNIITNNSSRGSNIYAGPFDLYAVHNVYAGNGDPAQVDTGNIRVTADGGLDATNINVYFYNNIFYKPTAIKYAWNYSEGYICDGSKYNLYSDYNSWVQNSFKFMVGSEAFVQWSFNLNSAYKKTFYYGADGPGHASGAWYNNADETGTGVLGHFHCDAHSKGTGADDPTLPPFTDVASNNFTLTTHYQGTDLSQKSWYIPEMGLDRSGHQRTTWDMGPYEFPANIPGDVSDNGAVTMYDAALALRDLNVGGTCSTLTPQQCINAQMDGQGNGQTVDGADVAAIAGKAMGL